MINARVELDRMRTAYATERPGFLFNPSDRSEEYYQKVESRDELNVICRDDKTLCLSGQVYYGYIVQANNKLFSWSLSPFMLPAAVLYSTEETTVSNFSLFQSIADTLMSYKDTPEKAPADLQDIVGKIHDEMSTFFNFPVPESITGGKKVFLTIMHINRAFLPGRKLMKSTVPIVSCPEECKSSFVLPLKYWTQGFVEHWKSKY